MNNEIVITCEEKYIQVHANGEKDIEFATKLWTNITDACEKNNCFNILGIANTKDPVNTTEAIDIVTLFEQLGINDRYRIAWVELNQNAYNKIQLIENLLSSHRVDCHLFIDVSEAEKWLFYGSKL